MKLLIACDMEGISGVVFPEHVTPGHSEYERFRRQMTRDANAAIEGAMEAGVEEILVTDGHWNSTNILIEELHPSARLISGTPSPFAMVEGIDSGVDAVFFIGYHARMGTLNAILDHTWSSMRVNNLWINGRLSGEIGLNGSLCGHFNVPVLLISGDQSVCAEALEWIPDIETAIVKRATGRHSADCLPPDATFELLKNTALKAIIKYHTGGSPSPVITTKPVELTLEFLYSDMADRAMFMPGSDRVDGRRVKYLAPDMPTAYLAMRTLITLANR